ncbi:MAG TPA: hypothetical protein VMS96_05785 [Terriglobales bacterium]|nr:hypothetical protein [Terriglobales bacterium]
MRKHGFLCAALLVLSASLGWTQAGPDKVCEVNVTTPKPGAAKQFEDARKKHNGFHQAEKDKNAIMVWSISTGPGTDKYLTATCGLTWKDMDGHDAFDKRDAADREKTLAPTIASNESSYYVLRSDLSSAPEPATPAKMVTVVHFFVKTAGVTQFSEGVKRINAAIAQTKYPSKPSRWYQLANGGKGPHFVLVTDRNSWADMQGPQQSLVDMLKQAYGNEDKTLQTVREAIDYTVSEILEYRADLSYMPAK